MSYARRVPLPLILMACAVLSARAASPDPPATWREKLTADWEQEKAMLEKAIKDDKERLAGAKTAKDRSTYSANIKKYEANLAAWKKQGPLGAAERPLRGFKVGVYGIPDLDAKIF